MIAHCSRCGRATTDPIRVVHRVWCAQCAERRLFELAAALYAAQVELVRQHDETKETTRAG